MQPPKFHLLSVTKQENCAVIIVLIPQCWLAASECCCHNSPLDSRCFSFILLRASGTPWYLSSCSFTSCCCFTYLLTHKYAHMHRVHQQVSRKENDQSGFALILNSQRARSFCGDGVALAFSLSVTARLFYCAHNAMMGDITQLQQVRLQTASRSNL